MKTKGNFFRFILLLFFVAFPSQYISSSTEQKEIWQKILIKDNIIGYSVVRKKGELVEERINMKLKAMGVQREVKTYLNWISKQDHSFRELYFEMESEGNKISISAKVSEGKLKISSGKSFQEIPIPQNKLWTGSSFIFIIENMILKGEKIINISIPYFDPSVLREDEMKINFERELGNFFVFRKTFAGISSFIYFDKTGKFIKEEGPMGIVSYTSEKDDVLKALEKSKKDIDIIFSTSVAVEGNLFPESSMRNKLKRVLLLISGVKEVPSFPPRQISKETKEGFLVEILKDAKLKDGDEISKYLSSEILIESDSPEIKKIAMQIKSSANSKSARDLMKAVSDWVYKNLEKTSVLSMPSALQVLKEKKGDCNEHSILTVAILRALNIPSRVVFGLIYDSQKFYYHAWVEAFDGKEWVEFDPTWGLFPADILRIRIGTGNVSEWVKVLEYVGKVRIKFIKWE
jgi:transglutaminase-like putative cysteine protease